MQHLDRVVCLDSSPIGRSRKSNPATYTKIFEEIRELFASTLEAKIRGYTSSRFSFNVKGGRCEVCKGEGVHQIEMHFLPDVYLTCEQCGGKRFNAGTLEIKYKGYTIADILEMTVHSASEFFRMIPKVYPVLQTLEEVGLGYLRLGQPAPTLSGGEVERLKLSRELAKHSPRTLYLLDEPSKGLHFEDVVQLIGVLQRLVNQGHTVILIEHHLDILKQVDYLIDLGAFGERGELGFTGTPEDALRSDRSGIAPFLKPYLKDR